MSDKLERLQGRAKRGDFWGDLPEKLAPAAPTEKNSVRRDSFDRRAWDEITDQVPALGEQVEGLRETHPTSPAAYEDLFNLLNQGDPRFVELGAMLSEYIPQHAMLQGMSASEDFKWVRNETRYDEYNTALAMLSMRRQMEESFDQVQEAMDAIEQAKQELQDAMDAVQAFLDAGGELTPGEPGEGGVPVAGQGSPEDEQALIERLQKAMDGMAQAEEDGDQAGDDAAAHLRKGASAARDEIEAEQTSAAAYGVEKGQLQRMDYAERRRLAERLDKSRLTRFANLIGGFRMNADAERRRKISHAPAEVFDVELGNDLHKMIASEYNNLAIPELEDLLWVRFAQRALPQWVTRGTENAGKGPIIVVCDESYSMTSALDAEGNTREAWSKAVSLALCDQAKRSKRDFIYIGFSSSSQVWETRFEKGIYDYDQVINFAEHFFGGGTVYEPPLTRAMEIIGTYEKARKAKPDIVFITDDECQVGPTFVEAWQEVKQRADVRCYGIAIGASGHSTAMSSLVDRTIEINQLNATPEAVTELFRTI